MEGQLLNYTITMTRRLHCNSLKTDGENTKERLTRYQLAYFNKNQLFLFNNQKNA